MLSPRTRQGLRKENEASYTMTIKIVHKHPLEKEGTSHRERMRERERVVIEDMLDTLKLS